MFLFFILSAYLGSGSRVPHSAGGGSAQGSADRVNNRTSVGSSNSNSGTSGFVGIAGEGLAQHLGKRKSPAEKGAQCFLLLFHSWTHLMMSMETGKDE